MEKVEHRRGPAPREASHELVRSVIAQARADLDRAGIQARWDRDLVECAPDLNPDWIVLRPQVHA